MRAVYATNLRCGKCVSTLKPFLDGSADILSWDVDLSGSSKRLEVEVGNESSADLVLSLIEEAGYEGQRIDPREPLSESSQPSIDGTSEELFQLSRYRPLVLVVLYVVGVTLFCEMLLGYFDAVRAMTHFMGFFFLGFAFFKLLNVQQFAEAFATYDPIASRYKFYGKLYPFIELVLGALFLSRQLGLLANLLTLVLMSIGLAGVIPAVYAGRKIQCACLGTVFNLPMSVVTIIENGLMIGMAAWMIGNYFFS